MTDLSKQIAQEIGLDIDEHDDNFRTSPHKMVYALLAVLEKAVEQRDQLMNDWPPWYGKELRDAFDHRNSELIAIAKGTS